MAEASGGQEETPRIRDQGPPGEATSHPRPGAVTLRSHPEPEARGCSWEEPVHPRPGQRPGGATPHPRLGQRSGGATPCPRPGTAAGKINPRPRSGGCTGTGGPRGAIPH